MPVHDNPVEKLNAASVAAARMRAAWLVAISDARATPLQLMGAATNPEGAPLLAVRIDALLGARHTGAASRSALALLRRRLSVQSAKLDRKITVGWLLRNAGSALHRQAVFVEVDELAGLRDRERVLRTFPFVRDDETMADVFRGVW